MDTVAVLVAILGFALQLNFRIDGLSKNLDARITELDTRLTGRIDGPVR